MKSSIGQQLRALGREELPAKIEVCGSNYALERIFKHDFFAVTARYMLSEPSDNLQTAPPNRVVLKLGRKADFLGLPLQWLGETLCRHEIHILSKLKGISQTPKFLCPYGKIGLIYEYIEGRSLDEKPVLADDFFDKLLTLLEQIHSRNIAYIDMNKRGNILLGNDGRPYIIDFQISWSFQSSGPFKAISQYIMNLCQNEDVYHLNKHKRRLARHLLDLQQIRESKEISGYVAAHRKLTRPLTRLRRRLLHRLYNAGRLIKDDVDSANPESNPERWAKY